MTARLKVAAMSTSVLLASAGLVVLAPPVTASADSIVTYRAAPSNRTQRVWKKDNCKGATAVLSANEPDAPWKVASISQKPHRVVLWNFVWVTRTHDKGHCYNVPPAIPVLALVIKYKAG